MIPQYSSYSVNDDVQHVSREKYDDVLNSYLDYIRRVPGVMSVYQLGNISVPGISDIDLIIVLHDEFSGTIDFRAAQREAAGSIGTYLFSHGPYVADRNTFADLPMLFFADNLRHIWGETLALNNFPSEQTEFYKYVIALEAAIAQSFAFIKTTHDTRIFNLRSLLCNLNAVKHNFTTLAPWRNASQRTAWRTYQEDIDALRNEWFQEIEANRIRRVLDLNSRATVILREVLDELLMIGRQKGYLRGMEHDALFDLLDLNFLLRFADVEGMTFSARRNPGKILMRLPMLGSLFRENRRVHEALHDVSVINLPRDFFSIIGSWFDGRSEIAKTIRRRVIYPRHLDGRVCSAKVQNWLEMKEDRLNRHFQFMRKSGAKGHMALTPATWFYPHWTAMNRLKTMWNRLWLHYPTMRS